MPAKRLTLKLFGFLALVSVIATSIAAVTGMVIIGVSIGPLSLVSILFPSILLAAFLMGSMYAAPVTFGVLPLAALLLKDRPIVAQLSLPLVGALAGAIAMWCWLKLELFLHYAPAGLGFDLMIGAGVAAGALAGAFYGRAVLEIRS